jgi:DNA polymerase III delta prime subunit
MTKNAQQALKYLLQTTTTNVRFCLICNYISKIDESLKHEFICVRFNQLPKQDIYQFIRTIAQKEGIEIENSAIDTIQTMYRSDIRSMINFLQLNQNFKLEEWNQNVMNSALLDKLRQIFKQGSPNSSSSSSSIITSPNDISPIIVFIRNISVQYNIDKKHIMHTYFNYIIRNYPDEITDKFLNIVDTVVHNTDTNIEDILRYFCLNLSANN